MRPRNKGIYRYGAKRAYGSVWIQWRRGAYDIAIRGKRCVLTLGDTSKKSRDIMKKAKRGMWELAKEVPL